MSSNARSGDDHSNNAGGQPFGGRVKINVGGSVFEASLSTLTRFDDSMFSALVAGRWQTQDELFIDRNPSHFEKVLDYLRDGKYVVLPKDDYSLECLQREAEFYNLPGLVEICSSKLRAILTKKVDNPSQGPPRIKINVGGTVFETFLSTLTKVKDSVFSTMLASHRQGQKELFFDRNPELFPTVMDYLRYGRISAVPIDEEAQEKLRSEAGFYNLPDLSMCVYKKGNKVKFVESAIQGYCLLDVRNRYKGWIIYRCKICGIEISPIFYDNRPCGDIKVPTYIGTEKEGVSVTYGVPFGETTLMSDLQYKEGTVKSINSTCCDVQGGPAFCRATFSIHLPKTALRLSG